MPRGPAAPCAVGAGARRETGPAGAAAAGSACVSGASAGCCPRPPRGARIARRTTPRIGVKNRPASVMTTPANTTLKPNESKGPLIASPPHTCSARTREQGGRIGPHELEGRAGQTGEGVPLQVFEQTVHAVFKLGRVEEQVG